MRDDLKMHDYKLPPRHDEDERAPAVLHRGLLRRAARPWPGSTSGSSRSPRRWPVRPGCLGFQERFPDRFFDVGHRRAARGDRGRGHGDGRAQARRRGLLDVLHRGPSTRPTSTSGCSNLPVVFVFDRAGVTGDDGPSHHGLLDLALCLAIPNMTVFAPVDAPRRCRDAGDGALDVDADRDPVPQDAPPAASTARSATGCAARRAAPRRRVAVRAGRGQDGPDRAARALELLGGDRGARHRSTTCGSCRRTRR